MNRVVEKLVAAAMLVFLVLGCTAADHVSDLFDRPRVVWMNAFAVANPDLRIIHERQDINGEKRDDSIEFLVEPRWPTPSFSEQYARHGLEIRRTSSGEIKVPQRYPSRMTEILQRFWRDRTENGSRDAGFLLKGLEGVGVRVTAIVELREPLLEEDVKKIWPYEIDVALLSPSRLENPISWDQSGYCPSRGFDACRLGIKGSLVSEFQHWVSLLTSDDSDVLDALGLGLVELQQRSQEGRYYGFILNAYPERVHKVIGNKNVHSVRIADIALAGL